MLAWQGTDAVPFLCAPYVALTCPPRRGSCHCRVQFSSQVGVILLGLGALRNTRAGKLLVVHIETTKERASMPEMLADVWLKTFVSQDWHYK